MTTRAKAIAEIIALQVAASLLLASCAHAADYYIAPGAPDTGPGTLAAPMSLKAALADNAAWFKPGDTLWLRGGLHQVAGKTYRYNCFLLGASNNFITVRNYNGERAIVDGNLNHLAGGYVKFWGLEITMTLPGRTTTQAGSWPTTWQLTNGIGQFTEYCIAGIMFQQPNPDKLINCYIHDCIGGGVGLWTSAPATELTGNVITQNGWVAPDRTHGHGIYGQNSLANPRRLVRDNLLFNNADHGSQFYGSVDVCNFDIAGNVFADNGALYTNAVPGGCNLLIGAGSISSNNTVTGNMVYRTPGTKGDGDGDHNEGYDQTTVGLVLSNNIFVSKSQLLVGADSVIGGNRFYGNVQKRGGYLATAADFPGNTFASRPTTGTVVVLRPNAYDVNRANLIIYNFAGAATVTVDVTPLGWQPGDTVTLCNAGNYYGDRTTRTVATDATVAVPMTGHTNAAPIEAPTPASTFPQFGAFVVLRTAATPPPVLKPVLTILEQRATADLPWSALLTNSVPLPATAKQWQFRTRLVFP